MCSEGSGTEEVPVGLVVLGAFAVTLYAGERITSHVRKKRALRRRGAADYPTTGNDPINRTVA